MSEKNMPNSETQKDLTNEELFSKICTKIEALEAKFDKLSENLATKVENYIKVTEELTEENKYLKNKVEYLENKVRRNNVVIYGLDIKENLYENTVSQLENLLEVKINQWDFNNIYKIGQQNNNDKPILVEFTSVIKKQEILKNCHKLKGKGVYINNDMSQQNREKHKLLRKYLNKAKNDNTPAYIKNNNLIIQGEITTYEDLLKIEKKEEKKQEEPNQGKLQKEKKRNEKPPKDSATQSTNNVITNLRNRKLN